MPWGPTGSLGGNIDPSRAAAVAERIVINMAMVPNKKEEVLSLNSMNVMCKSKMLSG